MNCGGRPTSVAASTLGHSVHWQEFLDSRLCRGLRRRPERHALPLVPPQYDAQFFMQPAMCAEKPQPHCYRGNSQPPGNLLRRVLQNVAQQADLPQIGSKLRDGAGQQRAHLAPRVTFLGIFLTRGDPLGNVFAGLMAVILKGDELGVAPLAKQVDRCICRDPRHPGVQVVLRFVRIAGELIEPREGLQHGLLTRVFRIRWISRQPQRAPVKPRRIRQHKLCERSSVAQARFTEQAGTPGGGKVCLGPANSRCSQA
jgi:hypothetical protein